MHVTEHFRRSLLWRSLAVGLLIALPAVRSEAREKKTVQKLSTDLQPKASDAYLDQSAPISANGGFAFLRVRSARNSANQRAIVQFDFSSLPNVGIKSAMLTLQVRVPPAASRRYEAHRLTSFYTEADVTWDTRVLGQRWAVYGGDYNGIATSAAVVTHQSMSASWDITPDVRSWYNGTPNYGTLIKDSLESGPGTFTVFASKEDPTPAYRPKLDLFFVQNVQGLAAAPGNNSVRLTWSYPAALGMVLEPNTGVVVLRRANLPVDSFSVPVDGSDPGLCAPVGTAQVVFDDFASATSFLDGTSNPCGAPLNGTTWFYKVFMRDSANNYSSNGPGGSAFTPEISATPDAIQSLHSVWMAGTQSTVLADPAVSPGHMAMVGAYSKQLFSLDAQTGMRRYPSISLNGAVLGRSPMIDGQDSSTGKSVVYVADQSGLVYGIDTASGDFLWIVNPAGNSGARFQGAGAVLVKSVAAGAYSRFSDLLIVGTRNPGTTSGNRILGIDGNTGATAWQIIGNTGSVPPLDIISSTPMIDYGRNAVWVTSRSAGSTAQPSLWKINPNNGAILATANLGDTDASPTLTAFGEVLFVGNNAGSLFAINPATGATLATFAGSDGAIHGYPVIVSLGAPFQIVFSGSTRVQMVSFDPSTNRFTPVWSRALATPSAPVGFPGLSKIYVGSGDGKIHEIDLATGVDAKQRSANPGQPSLVGDPSLDVSLSLIYVGTTDQRIYAFSYPF
jgi:hypothetical protein